MCLRPSRSVWSLWSKTWARLSSADKNGYVLKNRTMAEMGRVPGILASAASVLGMTLARTGQLAEDKHQLMPTSIVSNQVKRSRWLHFAILLIALVAVSFGLSYIFQHLLSPFQSTLYKFAWLAYLGVFGITLLGNLTIIAPVPVGPCRFKGE